MSGARTSDGRVSGHRSDGVMVLTDGSVLDRAGVAASLDQAPAWDSYTISEERLARCRRTPRRDAEPPE